MILDVIVHMLKNLKPKYTSIMQDFPQDEKQLHLQNKTQYIILDCFYTSGGSKERGWY